MAAVLLEAAVDIPEELEEEETSTINPQGVADHLIPAPIKTMFQGPIQEMEWSL
jgi:hypothetical protein